MFKKNNGFYKKRVIASFFILIFCFSFLIKASLVKAAQVDPVAATQRLWIIDKQILQVMLSKVSTQTEIGEKWYKRLLEKMKEMGSSIFQNTLSFALNTIAYDTANMIATAKKGQKPLFTTEYIIDVAKQAGNAALSEFTEKVQREWQVDLCRPSLDVQARIGLGLVAQQKPRASTSCDWQTMKQGWTSEYEKWRDITTTKDGGLKYLSSLSKSFSPTGNDLSVSLEILGRSEEVYSQEKAKEEEQLKITKGWLNVRNIGGLSETYPEFPKDQLDRAQMIQEKGLGTYTGSALVDASNIFLNQLGIAGFNRLVSELGKLANKPGVNEDGSDSDPSTSSTADPRRTDRSQLTSALRKVIKPRFNVRADYNLLSNLAVCLDVKNPAPTNCVIDNNFRQAIQNQVSLISAIEDGYLNPNMVFERNGDYQTTLNERSLMILRKFRIIPLGWEEALNRAEEQKLQTYNNYTLMDMVSCFDPNDEYNTFSEGFVRSNFNNTTWCEGLVDPNWVLKAPLHRCDKEGFGSYVINRSVVSLDYDIDISNLDNVEVEMPNNTAESIMVTRSDNYCADEKSCIKERADGSCEYYGYCTEEKRVWNFDQDSCDPIYNTCESFTSNSNGKKLALLKNTVDFSNCSVDSVGCSQYSLRASYNQNNGKLNWANYPVLFLNNKAETCSVNNEGCNEYLRAASGLGHNFIIGGDFEGDLSDTIWDGFDVSSPSYSGDHSLYLDESISKNIVVAPDNYNIAGDSYTLSFFASCSGNGSPKVSLGGKVQAIEKPEVVDEENFVEGVFIYQAITSIMPNNYGYNFINFGINPDTDNCLIDNIKLERGSRGTYYSNYRESSLAYQKIIPDYLKGVCYNNAGSSQPDYRLKENAPDICYNYARLCNSNEIGCSLFTSPYLRVAAKVGDKDYCPSNCVGYDVFVQKDSLFENKSVVKMIPESAQACSAANVGCTEFTNLENLAAGGESREYYAQLRHCIKPDQGTCNSFYSWQGSDESGYQLKSFNLEIQNNKLKLTKGYISPSGSSNNSYNHLVQSGSQTEILCSKDIYNKEPSDPLHNPDCQEFYNQGGEIFYVLYSNTITCSDNCKVYRLSEKNINYNINSSAACNNSTNQHWDNTLNVCYECLAGGKWDTTQEACIYQAIPGEGQSCPASANGCREYNGNTGNSVRNVLSFNFNSGHQVDFWEGEVSTSTESLNQGGQSMKLSGAAKTDVSDLVREGSSYVLRFLARSPQNQNLSISFNSNNGSEALFGVSGNPDASYSLNLSSSNDWKLYQVNLENLDHKIGDEEALKFSLNGSGNLYIANINLLEISDRYYLIKNSWNTPEICYYDVSGVYQGVNYNLGCQNYSDHNNQSHHLRHFSSLCDESAVGCEIVVDTHNSTDRGSKIFNDKNNNGVCDADEADCLLVPADSFTAIAYNPDKDCGADNKACRRLGKVIANNPYTVSQNLFSDTYIKINPDNLESTLCQAEEVGCDSWNSSAGVSYFKDPGDKICLWRKGLSNNNYSWYKKAVKRCKVGNSFTNNICNSSEDCSEGQSCELDTADYLCPVEPLKTIGLGGESPMYHPSEEFGITWAGACPISQSGCTEYIDPESSFSQNIINNPNFSDVNGDGMYFDYWNTSNHNIRCVMRSNGLMCKNVGNYYYIEFIQEGFLPISPNKLYVMEIKGAESSLDLVCDNSLRVLQPGSNIFSPEVNAVRVSSASPKAIFYSGNNNDDSCRLHYKVSQFEVVDELPSGSDNGQNYLVSIKEALVDYQIKTNLDFSSCNGQANLSTGCAVFNERAFSNSGEISSLNFNSSDYTNYSTCSEYNCDANALIKVRPNRVCGKWLSCTSYTVNNETKETTCLSLGECSAFRQDGTCLNYVKPEEGARVYQASRDLNASGYSVLGMNHLSNMLEVGQDDPAVSYDFEQESDFKAWLGNDDDKRNCWINRASHGGMGDKVTYPAHNLGFLKLGKNPCTNGNNNGVKKPENIAGTGEYYLSFMMNTSEIGFNEKVEVIVGKKGALDNSNFRIEISKESNWKDYSLKFKSEVDWNGEADIVFRSSSGGVFYVDKIVIEPILEISDNKYVQATCRLFPSQDSLICESSNRNVIQNGWYGYCLEKDPRNPDVCLLWYPIDAVSGSKGSSGASTAFTGYPESGAQPFYCAEMSANFDLVEYRDIYYDGVMRGLTHSSFGTSNGYVFDNIFREPTNLNYENVIDGIVKFRRVDQGCYLGWSSSNYNNYSFDKFTGELKHCPNPPSCSIVENPSTHLWIEECLADLGLIEGRFCDNERKYYAVVYFNRKSGKSASKKCEKHDNIDVFGEHAFDDGYKYSFIDNETETSRYSMISFCVPRSNNDLIAKTDSNELDVLSYLKVGDADMGVRACLPNESPHINGCHELRCCQFSEQCDENETPFSNIKVENSYKLYTNVYNRNNNNGQYYTNKNIRAKAQAGWYKYDGHLLNKKHPKNNSNYVEKKIKLVAYDYTQDECSGNSRDWIPLANGGNGCLMDLNDYVPKCTKIVQGIIPWVDRVSNSSHSLVEFFGEPNNVFSNYVLGSSHPPFGAINSSDNISSSENIYAGSGIGTNAKFGLPLSCNSFGKKFVKSGVVNLDTCGLLYYDDGDNKIKVFGHNKGEGVDIISNHSDYNNIVQSSYSASSLALGSNNWEWNSITKKLRNIWIKMKDIDGNFYDFSNDSNTPLNIIPSGDEEPGELEFKAQRPQVSHVNIIDDQGSTVVSTSGIYDIKNSGIYTVTLNTKVNKNQTPIKKLIIRVVRVDGNKFNLVGSYMPVNIDSLSDINSPHNYSLQLSKGEYIVLIKVVDNWGFYKYHDSGMGKINNNNNCIDCRNEFEQFDLVISSCKNCLFY